MPIGIAQVSGKILMVCTWLHVSLGLRVREGEERREIGMGKR
jgi:hypothetical protein